MLFLVAAASVASRDQRSQAAAIPLIIVSTLVWLVFVGLYPHTDPCGDRGRTGDCPALYGYTAPLQDDDNPAGHLFLIGAGFLVPAAVAGFRRVAPAIVVGAALAIGPALLMWPTAPRGDEDGLWVFFMVYIWLFALAAMAVAGLSGGIRSVADRVAGRVRD